MRYVAISTILPLALLSVACDDSTRFQIDPILVADTIEVWAPTAANAGRPSAIDIISFGEIGGARFPERASDAERWDVALRVRNGQLVLAPAKALGLESRSAITPAITDRTFDTLVEAPPTSTFRTDSAVVVRPGAVFVVRSRLSAGGMFGGGCEQYAKMQALTAEVAAARAVFAIVTNERCGDPRLAEEG